MSAPAALRFAGVTREFDAGGGPVRAVEDLSFEIAAGEFVAVTGRSGSGKSTLLNLAAGIDEPTRGEIWIAGENVSRMSDDARTILRRGRIGVVYQFFHLLPTLTVRENVALPLLLGRVREREALARAGERLAEVGLGPRAGARPHTLSGGELQRAAVARALVHEPALLLADEPTGNLDTRAAGDVLALLEDLSRRHGTTLVLVTHSIEGAARAGRVLELSDGRLVAEPRRR